MLTEDLIKAVMVMPEIRKIGMFSKDANGNNVFTPTPPDQLRETIKLIAPKVVMDVVREHDFPFGVGVDTDTTTANTSEYALKGKNSDCAGIVNIRYGSSERLLEQYNAPDMDLIVSDADLTDLGVVAWYEDRRENNFPVVVLVDTPDTAGETILYRYIKKDLGAEQWPTDFDMVLIDCVTAALAPERELRSRLGLARMVNFYARGKAKAQPPLFDTHIRNRNIERSRMNGYGCDT